MVRWGPVGSGCYLRPDQFLDHLTGITTFIEDLQLPCLENLDCTDWTTTFQIGNSSKYDLFGIATAKKIYCKNIKKAANQQKELWLQPLVLTLLGLDLSGLSPHTFIVGHTSFSHQQIHQLCPSVIISYRAPFFFRSANISIIFFCNYVGFGINGTVFAMMMMRFFSLTDPDDRDVQHWWWFSSVPLMVGFENSWMKVEFSVRLVRVGKNQEKTRARLNPTTSQIEIPRQIP